MLLIVVLTLPDSVGEEVKDDFILVVLSHGGKYLKLIYSCDILINFTFSLSAGDTFCIVL